MSFKKLSPLVITFIVLAILLVAGMIIFVAKKIVVPIASPVACTMEAKQCPDGSYVGRTGPNCEFAACPSQVSPPISLDCSGSGDSCPSGYTCIQKCGPPVARENDPPPGYYCELNEIANKPIMCPICLASNTNISTPDGKANIKDIKVGMSVWSVNAVGEQVASKVIYISHSDAPKTHKVVHMILSDSREVWVSQNHPTANGLLVGDLRFGDKYDGATIRSVNIESYWDNKTYDLLSDSETGFYWANDILLGSTLFLPF
ncbi:MAG: hypothetical protein ACD_76C00109G0004 [uncultured bacterium]|nr:MAG: hypothetical protein ACD_76C00109G0004 [uncultured bacterium]HBD04928.1 hypothetical protein [Candidatus Uhrbacteria bacterium]